MATAVIYGGLGNQLFKYFASLNLSKLHGTGLNLDLSWYSNSVQNRIGTNRRLFELNKFPNIPINVSRLNRLKGSMLSALQTHLPIDMQSSLGIVSEANYLQARRFIFSQGNFENFCYLPDFEILRSALSVKSSANSWLGKTLALATLERPIGIHVRMTDYQKFSSIYNVLSIDYYSRALAHVQTLIGESPIWLFSDDPHSARDFLEGTTKVDRIMPLSNEISSVDTIVAMSLCQGIISANSTFSWWAGLRGSVFETTRVVVQPRFYDSIAGDQHSLAVPLSNWFICEN
jgi:hypothetical protein